MRTSGWRIALLTVAPNVVHNFTHFLRSRNHDVVALVAPAGVHGHRPRNAAGWNDMARLLEAAPPSLDVVIASERAHLTPLLASLKPDLLLCFFFPWRIPPEALAVAPLGAVNGHPSLLPRYRGPNPLGWTLRNDDRELGLSFHRMDAHFDTGPLLDQDRAPIEDSDTEEVIADKMMNLAMMMMPQVLERVAWGDAGEPQPATGGSQAPFFEPAYRELDWRQPARALHLQVRACRFGAWKDLEGDARATLEGRRVRVQRTQLVDGATRPSASSTVSPGTVLARESDGVLVQCGDGPLRLLRYAPE
ncbi:methionyl-tRNA formyltransferase [Hyalangium rubrum]|uniref:Formyltransferase family protein n=1 Tax=Hyalangium rubrum TaxID=3103134 RepID=A0ABU5H0B1_9BACT|nr:formyltransferase family protein [Hyalangium sp. s54d21]MDY7226845.1 formyltransferase family protein [Hyalangium sp. s54d21]